MHIHSDAPNRRVEGSLFVCVLSHFILHQKMATRLASSNAAQSPNKCSPRRDEPNIKHTIFATDDSYDALKTPAYLQRVSSHNLKSLIYRVKFKVFAVRFFNALAHTHAAIIWFKKNIRHTEAIGLIKYVST